MKTMFRLGSLFVATLLIVTGCSSDDTPKGDGPGLIDSAGADSSGGLCGGSVCAPGSVCCGPAECGFCIPENSGAYCPPACPDAGITACSPVPSGFCDPGSVEPCQDGVKTCRCVGVCSGRRPPPGEEYAWQCTLPPDPRCPALMPQEGDGCTDEGLACSYSSCGGDATCTDGKWHLLGAPP